MPAQQISNTFVVKIDGRPLPADVTLGSVVVEDHLHLPDSFVLMFRDSARTALTKSNATIGSSVSIAVQSDAAAQPEPLVVGTITAIEAEVYGGTSSTVVRGFDQSHLLFRGRSTASYHDMAYSDVAGAVARRCRLQTGTIDATRPTHTHITQANEDDWHFLGRLAREVGFEVTVSDSKLHFRRPVRSTGAPPASDVGSENRLTLQAGSNLLMLRAVVTSSEQVEEIEVRAWDPTRKQALTSRATIATTSVQNSLPPGDVARIFPSRPLVSTGVPYSSATEVEAAAAALADEVGSSCTEIEGQARGNPQLRAGVAVRLGLVGDPFDGTYVLTSTRHSYDADEGYVTGFVVSGRQERSLLGLTGGGAADGGRVAGVVPAIVDDVNDPERLGRVRMRFPWMDDDLVTDWSRVALPGAGNSRGLVVLPEVGDEVLVAFEQGDMRRPYVLGGLYNRDDPPLLPDPWIDDGKTNNRLLTSRTGHQLSFVDADRSSAVVLRTADEAISIKLDQSGSKLVLTCGGDVEISADGAISIEAGRDLTLKGSNVTIEGQSSVSVTGPRIKVEGSGPTEIKGQPVKLN